MSHIRLSVVMSLLVLGGLFVPSIARTEETAIPAGETPVDLTLPTQETSAVNGITVSFTSNSPGHMFLPGKPMELTIHIHNTGPGQKAKVNVIAKAGLGSVIYDDDFSVNLSENGSAEETIILGDLDPLPRGSYLVTVFAKGDLNWGFNSTRVSVWDGPASMQSDIFGISYSGPLDVARTYTDLDLFKQAGIGWIRFPMQGWLPPIPAAADTYSKFIEEASSRDFKLLAAFTPRVTVDPSANEVQAWKDLHESVLAAITKYGFKLKYWELLHLAPPSYPVGMKGIGYRDYAPVREAIRRADKSLQMIFPLATPFEANDQIMFHYGLPYKGDAIGIHYDFVGIPENQKAVPKPPIGLISQISDDARGKLKRVPPMQATEYGFDPEKGNKLPQAVHQAALISRALIMNRISGIERTFWRHNPDAQYDLPFTCPDGAAQPSLLAIRTTLAKLQDATSITPVTTNAQGTSIFMVRYSDAKKPKSSVHNVRYGLIAWSESESTRTGMSLKTKSTQITVTDLWGNAIDLQPSYNTAFFQVDEFPRFIDLGTDNKIDLRTAFGCTDFNGLKFKVISPEGDNNITFRIRNDQLLFNGSISGELRIHAWPIPEDHPQVTTQRFELNVFESFETPSISIRIPANIRNGEQVCEVSVEIMMGTCRVGYLTLPVFYSKKTIGAENE